MMGEDEIDCGSFFDHIDDLLDFPPDDAAAAAGDGFSGGQSAVSPAEISTPKEAVTGGGCVGGCGGGGSFFSGKSGSSSDCSPELSVPYEDIVQLEWLSNFVEDSFSDCGMLITDKDSLPVKNNNPCTIFQSCSPVSVLESSTSSFVNKYVRLPTSKSDGFTRSQKGRARSKRPRPATFNPRPVVHLMPIASSESSAESHPLLETAAVLNPAKKKKKVKPTTYAEPSVRKCMHCEITKTPQWRAGPMGAKTLCNACGVRYKSGRLFPEYRPAASPTFVAAMHSNSHKKVLEMRVKGAAAGVDSLHVEDGVLRF